MAGKIYTPTPEQLDRWAEEMKHWRDARLVNRDYYDAIDAEMAQRPTPTLGGAVNVMLRQGNRTYLEAYPGMDLTAIEDEFKPITSLTHEATHLAARIGHTPEQEMQGLMFEIGLTQGTQGALRDPEMFHKHIGYGITAYRNTGQGYREDKESEIPVANPRQQAIYLAAGMYLRQKLDGFNGFGLPDKPYILQKQFADHYATSEPTREEYGVPSLRFLTQPSQLLREQSPYSLIKLADAEWEAIIAVATGVRTPEQTPYAERLKPIATALEALALDHEAKSWIERAVKDQAKHHPKGEGFDPERFKVAREKRGVDPKGRG